MWRERSDDDEVDERCWDLVLAGRFEGAGEEQEYAASQQINARTLALEHRSELVLATLWKHSAPRTTPSREV